MNKKPVLIILSLLVMLAMTGPVVASGSGNLENSAVNIRDVAAAQRGAKWFVNYCFSCQSAR